MIEIRRGKFTDYKEQIFKLTKDHWNETGLPGINNPDLDINMDVYKELEDRGMYLGLGLIEDDDLFGYLSIIISESHLHKGVKIANTDGFFIRKDKRGYSSFKQVIKMFNKAESILRNEFNVEYFYLNTHASNDLKFLAECMEFLPTTVTYVKRVS